MRFLIFFLALSLSAQVKTGSIDVRSGGRFNAGSAASTAPVKVGTSLPGTCTVGDLYYKSDATAGSNLYGCTSTNTWTVQAGGGNITIKVDGSTIGTEANLDFLSSSGITCVGTDTGSDITIECSVDTAVILSRATHQAGTDLYCNSSDASGTTYTCSLTPTLTAYTTGMMIVWNRSQLCTGGVATTLNINSLGATGIKKTDGSTDPAAGDCTANQRLILVYDGTNFRIVGGGASSGGDPDTYLLTLTNPTVYRDEFLGPFFTNNFGDLLWNFTYPSAVPTYSRQVVSGRPGVIRITTAAGDNDGGAAVLSGRIHPDAFTSSTGWELNFVVRPQDSTSARYYVGVTNYSGGGGEPTVTEGIYIEYDTDQSDTEWMCVSDGPSGITRQTTGQAVVSGTWYTLRIYSTTSGQILCSANGNTSSPVSTDLPTTTSGLQQTIALNTRTTATRYLDIDIYTAKIVNSR